MKKVLILGLVVLMATGVAQAQEGEDELPPPPGEMVDVGGYALHLNCVGEGNPTVVMDAGHGHSSLNLASLQAQVAEFTQVCTFDRAGYGWSEAGPEPRTSQQNTDELKTLLENAGVEGPYILVGQSLGGLNMILFAAENPDLTAGVVLLDASHPDQMESLEVEVPEIVADQEMAIQAYRSLLTQAEQGTLTTDMVADFRPQGLSGEAYNTWAQLFIQPKNLTAIIAEYEALDEDLAQVKENGDLGDIPLVVITHGLPLRDVPGVSPEVLDTFEELWRGFQEDHLNRSTNSTLIVAENSSLHVYLYEPELVVDALRELAGVAE